MGRSYGWVMVCCVLFTLTIILPSINALMIIPSIVYQPPDLTPETINTIQSSPNELIELHTANSKTFLNHDGTRRTEVSLSDCHWQDEDGSWQPFDLRFRLEEEGIICDTNGLVITLPQRLPMQARLCSANAQHQSLAWSPITMSAQLRDGRYLDIAPHESSMGTIDTPGQEVTYRTTHQHTDEEYQVSENKLKHTYNLKQLPILQHQ